MSKGLCPLFRSRAEAVHGFAIGGGHEQEIDELTMSTDGRGMQRGGVADSTACVDIGAALEEQSPDLRLATRPPLQRRPANPGRMDPGSRRAAGVDEGASASRNLRIAGTSPYEHAQKMSEASALAPCAMR